MHLYSYLIVFCYKLSFNPKAVTILHIISIKKKKTDKKQGLIKASSI